MDQELKNLLTDIINVVGSGGTCIHVDERDVQMARRLMGETEVQKDAEAWVWQ
jgi:hypothetical protein